MDDRLPRAQIEEGLYCAALSLPQAERIHFLERASSEDAGMLRRLLSLLDATPDAESFITERLQVRPFEVPVEWIGTYRVVQELGDGGHGICYLAEQSSPVKRLVALKMIKPGMDTRDVIARFGAERQALALMEHPHIAQVYDAGESSAGRPYFVMELVRGIRITTFCNQTRMNVKERLELFNQVCSAIQHAHTKGIIHRDIKPSNVLVTMSAGVAVAKVIDFGLAKALEGPLTGSANLTAVEHVLGTPAYVSPEQTEPGQRRVDTRSDVYGLGVLLYELLTGWLPFDEDLLRRRVDLVKRIREEEPIRPSKRLLSIGEKLVRPAHYGMKATQLRRHLQGDLDWIVMKCLEKDPGRRYQAASDLALDLGRYLDNQPVLARPPSAAYTVSKFARRHRALFAGGVALILFILAFTVTLSIQAQRLASEKERAETERQHAEQITTVVLHVVSSLDPFENVELQVSGSGLLDQAAKDVKEHLNQGSTMRAPLLEAIGRAFRRLGEARKATALLRDAVRARQQKLSADPATLGVMVELSNALRADQDIPGSQVVLREANDLAKVHRLERTPSYARLLLSRAHNLIFVEDLAGAKRDLQHSLQLSRELTGLKSKDAADALVLLSRLLLWTDDFTAAEDMAREAVAIFEATLPPMHPDRVFAEARLAEVLIQRNDLNAAEKLLLDALSKLSQRFGRQSWKLADVLNSLARIRRLQGRFDEAEVFAREAIHVHTTELGEENPGSSFLRSSLAALLIDRQKYADAEVEIRLALSARGQTAPSDQYVASFEYLLGEVLLATRRLSEAENVLTSSVVRWKRSGAPPWRSARSASALGEVLYRLGRKQEAELLLTDSYRELRLARGAEPEARRQAKERFDRYAKGARSESG